MLSELTAPRSAGPHNRTFRLRAALCRHSRFVPFASVKALLLLFTRFYADTRAPNYYRHNINTTTVVPSQEKALDRLRFWNRTKTA